jgi:hypothetical protein
MKSSNMPAMKSSPIKRIIRLPMTPSAPEAVEVFPYRAADDVGRELMNL